MRGPGPPRPVGRRCSAQILRGRRHPGHPRPHPGEDQVLAPSVLSLMIFCTASSATDERVHEPTIETNTLAAARQSPGQPPVASKWRSSRVRLGSSARNARRFEIAYHRPRLLTRHQERHPHAAISPGLPARNEHMQCMRHAGGVGSCDPRRLMGWPNALMVGHEATRLLRMHAPAPIPVGWLPGLPIADTFSVTGVSALAGLRLTCTGPGPVGVPEWLCRRCGLAWPGAGV